MKPLLVLTFIAAASPARAQWQTTEYSLKGGWNAISLTGDAAYDTPDNILPVTVLEVWKWNPNPTQVQFTESPLIPSAGTPEWSVWKRGLPGQSTLSQLHGPGTFLVKCSGTAATTHTVNIRQSPRPPSNVWVRNGANLLGFPALRDGPNAPYFGTYFSTFPIALASNTRIYKYIGGDLGPANPAQVFSTDTEQLDRTKAYWFSAEVTGTFYAPIEVSAGGAQGMAFGRTGSTDTAHFRNRTGAPVTLTFTPENSEAAPVGQPAVTAPVPLTRRTLNNTTLLWESTAITGVFTEVIGPQANLEVHFGVDRGAAAMTGAPANAFFASILRITDSGNLMDIRLPASATKASLAGLWVGDISLNKAGYAATGAGDSPREFPLRTLLHVSDDGTARLLSKVFIGPLAAGSHEVGLCTAESLLKADAKATARRMVAAHMPLDRIIASGSGSVSMSGTLTRTITVPFDDMTNPFVHQYHPDHDNKDARGNPLPAGVESHSITRTCAFTFTATPPPGANGVSGWGAGTIGGTYSETLAGLHKNDISVTGTFILHRASELGTLHMP